jgi:hypothetical protein
MKAHMDVILWACEREQWTHKREQVSPSKSFQKYPIDIDKIFFDAWDIYVMMWRNILPGGHEWIVFLDDKMDDKSNGWNFIKMDAKLMKNHGWPTISLIKDEILSCWFYLEKHHMKCWCNTSSYTSIFFYMNFCNI